MVICRAQACRVMFVSVAALVRWVLCCGRSTGDTSTTPEAEAKVQAPSTLEADPAEHNDHGDGEAASNGRRTPASSAASREAS